VLTYDERPASAPAVVRPPRRFGVTVVLTLLIAGAGTAGTLAATRSAIDGVPRVPGVAEVLSPASATVENFLLVGSDSRAGVDPNAPDAAGIGTEADVDGTARSDTIMVLRRDKATGQAALLSIPRDLWVAIPGRGDSRINAAYNSGPATLVQTVQQSLGIPVHHYIEVNFSGFKQLVDAIGGVEICSFDPFRDVHTGLYVAEGGCHLLDGVQALAYARSRYYEVYKDGEWHVDGTADIGRTKRQQQFVSIALTTALAKVKANPFIAGEVLTSSSSAISLDEELDVLHAASTLRVAVDAGLATWSLPIYGENIDGNAVLLLADGAEELLAYFRGDGPAPAPQG
jgi:LCP family protein required for cell wall assembly